MRSVATEVAILDRVKLEERPAWLDRFAKPAYRYVLKGGGEDMQPLRRRGGSVFGGPQGRAWGRPRRELCLPRSTGAIEKRYAHSPRGRQSGDDRIPRAEEGEFALVARGARRSTLLSRILHLGCREARNTTAGAPRARAQKPGFGSARRARYPEDGPKEVARAAAAFNAMQRRIAEQAVERIRILADGVVDVLGSSVLLSEKRK